MAVGIGKRVNESEREIIAGDKNRVIAVNSVEDPANQLDSVREDANSKIFLLTFCKKVVSQFVNSF